MRSHASGTAAWFFPPPSPPNKCPRCLKNTGKKLQTQGKCREFHFNLSVATLQPYNLWTHHIYCPQELGEKPCFRNCSMVLSTPLPTQQVSAVPNLTIFNSMLFTVHRNLIKAWEYVRPSLKNSDGRCPHELISTSGWSQCREITWDLWHLITTVNIWIYGYNLLHSFDHTY